MRLTVGQTILLIVIILMVGFLDFYLGARFGPELFWGVRIDERGNDGLLPSDISEEEIEALLREEDSRMTFHEVLAEKALPLVRKKEAFQLKKEEPKKEDPPRGRYSLQLGSFADRQKAENFKSKFKSSGLSAFVEEVQISDKGKWYRVYLGPYPSFKEAESAKVRVYDNYKILPMVVKLP